MGCETYGDATYVIFVRQERRLASVDMTLEQNTTVSGIVQASIPFLSEGYLEVIL
jgi:hypothetical protein